MNKQLSDLGPSRQSAAKTMFETFKILKEAGGNLSIKQIIEKIPDRIELTEWEKKIYGKTGYVRWQSILFFYSINCIKAGFLRKNKGIWYLTDEGEKEIKHGALSLLETTSKLYRNWAIDNKSKKNQKINIEEEQVEIEEDTNQLQLANLDFLESQASIGIKEFIRNKNAYEFQNLVAALLRAMDYYTPFIAPKGKDGGLDIVAYSDPLGATEPRIKVQVKHRPDDSIPVNDIRSLTGLLNKNGDVGLFVTSGIYTSESIRFARESHQQVKLIDINEFIQLWQVFYSKLKDEDKNLLPLHPIWFLGSND